MADPFAGLHPEFAARLRALIAASGGRVRPGSGYRSIQEQADLYRRFKAGTYKVPAVAPPGKSNHNFGLAMDLQGDLAWANANAHRFGLHFPVRGEPWHVEAIGLNRHTVNMSEIQFREGLDPMQFDLTYEDRPKNPEDELASRLQAIVEIIGLEPSDDLGEPDSGMMAAPTSVTPVSDEVASPVLGGG